MYVFLSLLIASFYVVPLFAEYGYICVPVADLITQPFELKKKPIADLYKTISLSPERHKNSCLRAHQAIFNEKVEILDYKNEQIYIALTNCYAVNMPRQMPTVAKFWTRANWVVTEQTLEQAGIDLSIFPEPFSHHTLIINTEVITLIVPWYDAVTNKIYSAGTRFVTIPARSSDDYYMVVLYDCEYKKNVYSMVDKSRAFPSFYKSRSEQKRLFVALLRQWCSLDQSIPYVWGGTSFTYTTDSNSVILEEQLNNNKIAYWNDPSISIRPYAGFDCSGLLLRAAQIVGIPYFCLNSTSALYSLKPLSSADILEEGDIIWAPGYLAVVSSITNNQLIEAQGYGRGYGSVHEISLEKRFKDISTWDDFLYFHAHHLPLQSYNSTGQIVGYIPTYFILRFLNL